jgi:5-methylcytosine-specific restriction endonuclease McrA
MNKYQKRNLFREGVFERDSRKCKICGNKEKLDAHHITDRHEMPNGGYVLSNGISLCEDCHWKAEQYHMTLGNWNEDGFHPDDLYKKIGSSYDIARKDSENL